MPLFSVYEADSIRYRADAVIPREWYYAFSPRMVSDAEAEEINVIRWLFRSTRTVRILNGFSGIIIVSIVKFDNYMERTYGR